MSRSLRLAVLAILWAAPSAQSQLTDPVWSLGSDDGAASPFQNESYDSNAPPGSASAKDDDYYFAGTYAPPIGTVASDEAVSNVERAVTEGDPRVRFHFPLTAAQRSSTARLFLTIDLYSAGMWVGNTLPGFGSHDVEVRLNGQSLGTWTALRFGTVLRIPFDAVDFPLTAEDNILEVERTGGSAGGYILFDFLRLDADADALADGDADGMPRWYEETYGLDDGEPADAVLDPDGDGLSSLAESALGTNPTNPDTDHDGLPDNESSDPLDPDSDGDGLLDGDEVTTHPAVADSDGDDFPDGYEVAVGTDPGSDASQPFAFAGSIGLQFLAERPGSVGLGPWEIAGVVPAPHWNHSDRQPLWPPNATALTGSASGLVDGTGSATPVTAGWSFGYATVGRHSQAGDPRILNGSLGTDQPFGPDVPVEVTLSGIPFSSYDLIAYVGGPNPYYRASVALAGDPTSTRYLLSGAAPPFLGWNEATATSTAEVELSNFVRFRGLSTAAQTIVLQQLDNDSVGLHGIQIIDMSSDADSDGIPDAVEIEMNLDPQVPDATADPDQDGLDNAAEVAAGTDPHDADSDDDGLQDGDETTTDPLDPDSDEDGLRDGDEVHGDPFPSLPTLADSDSDGRNDAAERAAGTDPMNPADVAPGVPEWTAATRTWHWQVDDLSLRWNHGQSPMAGRRTELAELVTELDDGGWSSAVRMGLYYRDGVVTYRFRCIEDVFHQDGEPTWAFYHTGSTQPANDLKHALGFSGFGDADDSLPLRFTFTANQPDPGENLWTLTFQLHQTADPGNPVLLGTHTWTNAVAADPRLLDGSAPWTDASGNPGVPSIETEPGVDAVITRNPLGPADGDHDGMPDDWENAHLLDPSDPTDATLDPDIDGLNNRDEFFAGTDPNDDDSDDDGVDDGEEIRQGSSPTSGDSIPAWFHFTGTPDDLDGDGLSDAWTMWAGGTPRAALADDDGDGMTNLEESEAGTDPDDPNSRLDLAALRHGNDMVLDWPDIRGKAHVVEFSESLGGWNPATGLPPATSSGGRLSVTIPDAFGENHGFYRTSVLPLDADGDGVDDWVELEFLASSTTSADSSGQATERSGQPHLSGDARALLEKLTTGTYPGSTRPGIPSPTQAARFLMQASFGPTPESIDRVREIGYEAWIDEQLALPPSRLRPYVQEIKRDAADGRLDPLYDFNEGGGYVTGYNVTTPWARHAIDAPDQLRQRVAFALSQILVVSRRDAQLAERVEGLATYYDMLIDQAFGDYGGLLHDVSLHPVMGWYLSHVGNQKADPSIPRFPDENYAREIMQLFSIGLWDLNMDGTRKTDEFGQPIETYGNGEITELARVFTGLFFDAPWGWGSGGWADDHYVKPMVMHPDYHDFESKTLLGGIVIPARDPSAENGLRDIRDAVDSLVRHPNTAPFISKKLIQFLVTANPSPAYVGRVAAVFADDGSGARGNLGAVVKAILLDSEARAVPTDPAFGKTREPVIRTMHLARLMKLTEAHPDFVWWNPERTHYAYSFQEPLLSPNVFNFFTPEYQAPGEIRNAGLVSPGFQIVDSYSAISFPNLLWEYLNEGYASGWSIRFDPDHHELLKVAGDHETLVDRVNLLLCAGNMSARTRTAILDAFAATPDLTAKDKVVVALWTTINSPEGATQR
ncbi:DUF1800 family protein [Haloferula sp. A504]|uniref:DUF1800 family protein n=1 Tax=Haloferula sp. A504 TaxID=3373601 RepID=UPI0031BE5F89|nr:DUF1800 family protein [Verrucomicrobiaceae bacterium E54]